jgi:probable phosphoglycerate mutase
MARVTALVCEYEEKISAVTILLISHGDALQILQTAFSKQCASEHRRQLHLETAEIRELSLS